MIKNRRYTKSRLHEKLNIVKKISCGVSGIVLASAVVMTALAKEPSMGNSNLSSQITYKTYTVSKELEPIVGVQNVIEINKIESKLTYIRCTVYCDTGYTASGSWTTSGCMAGKPEWLGRACKLYKVNRDGTPGECIGTFRFEDTGFGLKELDGVSYPDGTIHSGKSVDMWHPTEEECWSWISKYGDYVYMELLP